MFENGGGDGGVGYGLVIFEPKLKKIVFS